MRFDYKIYSALKHTHAIECFSCIEKSRVLLSLFYTDRNANIKCENQKYIHSICYQTFNERPDRENFCSKH